MTKPPNPIDPRDIPSRRMKNQARRLARLQQREARERRIKRATQKLERVTMGALRAYVREVARRNGMRDS